MILDVEPGKALSGPLPAPASAPTGATSLILPSGAGGALRILGGSAPHSHLARPMPKALGGGEPVKWGLETTHFPGRGGG